MKRVLYRVASVFFYALFTWFTRIVVAAAVIDALASLDLHYPKVDKEKRKELAAARRVLARSGS